MFNRKKNRQNMAFTQKIGVYHEPPRMMNLINWAYVDEKSGIVHCTNDDMFSIFEFRGPDMDSATHTQMVSFNMAINNVIKSLPTGYVLYFDAQRSAVNDYDKSQMPVPILQQIEDEREQYYRAGTHYESKYYFIVFMALPSKLQHKFTNMFVTRGKKAESASSDEKIFIDTVTKFVENVSQIGDMLATILSENIHLLTDPNEILTYLHTIISDHYQKVQVNFSRYILDYVPDCGLLCGREPKLGNSYFKVVTILDFPPVGSPAMLDILNNLDMEYRWVSRYICLSKQDAQEELENFRKLWGQQFKSPFTQVREAILKERLDDQINENAVVNEADVRIAQTKLNDDSVAYGFYTMTLIVSDTDKDRCNEKALRAQEIIRSRDFTCKIEEDNTIEAWRGSLPGCYKCNIRRPLVNTLNFCLMAPVTAIWPGDKKNDYLKGPVLLYTDSSGFTPFRLSLHVHDVGHTMICGPSGTGKSVLLNTLEAHFLKYPDSKVFIFDKAASSRALTYAVDGHFYNIASEDSGELSFQPLARIDNENEIKWAKEWLLAYLRQKNLKVGPPEENYVWKALLSLKEFPSNQRTISIFCEMVQSQEIRQALMPLTNRGSFGSLFDNDKDFSGTGRWQVYEMETLMATPAIVPATLDYLFHRIETSLKEASGPSIIVLDECWLFFDNPAFKEKLREYFKDMRKKNTSIIFATQNLADVANKPDLLTTVMENCPNRIYLPNVNATNDANSELYHTFGCNEQQIAIISQITPKQDYYYSSPKGNRIFQLALQPAEFPFVTATSKNDQIAMNHIINAGKKDHFIEEWLRYKGYDDELKKYQNLYL